MMPIPRRHPWQLAKSLARFDQFSKDRVLLAAGLGAPWEVEAFGTEYGQHALPGFNVGDVAVRGQARTRILRATPGRP